MADWPIGQASKEHAISTEKSSAPILVIAGIFLAVIAGAAGWFLAQPSADTEARLQVALERLEAADEQVATLKAGHGNLLQELEQVNQELTARSRKLEQSRDRLQAQLEVAAAAVHGDALPAAAETEGAETDATGQRALAVAFGEWSELEGLSEADWGAMAETTAGMLGMIEELFAGILAGEDISQEDQLAIARENQKLVAFALNIIGKLPTHAKANGEFTHPAAMANLTAAVLEQGGQPLSAAQTAEFERLGAGYDRAWDSAQSAYGESTPNIQKLADELALKQQFTSDARAQLTAAQLEQLTPESILDRTRLDVLSPVVMTVAGTRVLEGGTPEELRGSYAEAVARGYDISEEQLASIDYVFDTWLAEVQPALTPTSAEAAQFYDLNQAVISAQAHAHVLESILASGNLDPETRERMLSNAGFAVPRLVQ